MTKNNRFTVPVKYSLSHSKIQLNGQPLTNAEIVRLLNTNDEAFVKNFNLKREIEELKKENVKLQNGFNLLEEENKDLNKFFLYACKTTEYLKWKKELQG